MLRNVSILRPYNALMSQEWKLREKFAEPLLIKLWAVTESRSEYSNKYWISSSQVMKNTLAFFFSPSIFGPRIRLLIY